MRLMLVVVMGAMLSVGHSAALATLSNTSSGQPREMAFLPGAAVAAPGL
jgi:hypothetical protein